MQPQPSEARDEAGELRERLGTGQWRHLANPLLPAILLADAGPWWSKPWLGAWARCMSVIVRGIPYRRLHEPVVVLRIAFEGKASCRFAAEHARSALGRRPDRHVRAALDVLEQFAPP